MSPSERDSIELLRRDHTHLASSVSGVVVELATLKNGLDQIRIDNARKEERDIQTQRTLNSILNIGKLLLLAVSGGFIAAIVTFIVRGGLNVT